MEARASEAAWRTLVRAHAVVLDAIERELERGQGIPLTWHEVLFRLAAAPDGALRMQDLADRLVLSRSGATRLVDRLEKAGLIERASCPSDRRGTYAVLTAAGRSALAKVGPLLRSAIAEHFGRHLSEAEAGQLQSILRGVLAALGQSQQDEECAAALDAEAVAARP